jgi:hypothetical protein
VAAPAGRALGAVIAVSPFIWLGALLLVVLASGCAPAVPPADQLTIMFHYSRF